MITYFSSDDYSGMRFSSWWWKLRVWDEDEARSLCVITTARMACRWQRWGHPLYIASSSMKLSDHNSRLVTAGQVYWTMHRVGNISARLQPEENKNVLKSVASVCMPVCPTLCRPFIWSFRSIHQFLTKHEGLSCIAQTLRLSNDPMHFGGQGAVPGHWRSVKSPKLIFLPLYFTYYFFFFSFFFFFLFLFFRSLSFFFYLFVPYFPLFFFVIYLAYFLNQTNWLISDGWHSF